MKKLLLLIIIVFSTIACIGSGSTQSPTKRPPREVVTVKSGQLRDTIQDRTDTITKDTVIRVQKLDGSYDNRQNDLRELCLDFIFYRDRIIKETARGNTAKADDARMWLDRINVWLNAYHEDDIGYMWTLIKQKGW